MIMLYAVRRRFDFISSVIATRPFRTISVMIGSACSREGCVVIFSIKALFVVYLDDQITVRAHSELVSWKYHGG